jgi:hypothetical protein
VNSWLDGVVLEIRKAVSGAALGKRLGVYLSLRWLLDIRVGTK